MAGSDIPLLNHYKKKFLLSRLPQTFLGGIVIKLGHPAPCYAYLGQILLWLLPFIIGGSFTLAVEVGRLHPLHGSIGNGVVVGTITLFLQLSSKVVKKQISSGPRHNRDDMSMSSEPNGRNLGRLLAEEDEIFFDSFFSATTLLFLIPPKRNYASIVLSSLISAFVSGLGLWYSLPYSTLTVIYLYSEVGSTFLFIFSWITICIGHYPLLIGNPVPETAAYRSVDLFETQNLSRALHISLFLCPFLVDIIVISSTLTDVNNVLHIIFCTLPLLWFFGIIPPFDALVVWSMEQILTFCLGGSYMSTDWRLLFMFLSSSAVLIGLSFTTSTQVLVSCSVGFGFLLSTDITSLLCYLMSNWSHLLSKTISRKSEIERFDQDVSQEKAIATKSVPWKQILYLGLMFSLAFVGTYLSHYYSSSFSGNSTVKYCLEYVFIAIFPVSVICKEMQRVYTLFGIFRNSLFPLTTLSQRNFSNRKRYLRVFGVIQGFLLHFAFPLLSSIYLSFFLFESPIFSPPSFELALGCIHGLRFVWQRPGQAVASFMILSILNLIPVLSNSSWSSLFMGTRLIILDACWDRLFQFFDNAWFVVTLTITSWTDKKQRRSKTLLLVALNVVIFPVTLCFIVIASILSAPLLPIFTLPIFVIGFPRPARFWPAQPGSTKANICQDTVYYQELADPVSEWFSSEIGLGIIDTPALSSTGVSPYYIARSQDRTLWLQVLESGYGYSSLIIKGLELQETSCHALEATRLDDAFDIAFEKTELDLRCIRTNRYFGTAVVMPVDSTFLDGHSDAKNSLKGIAEHPDTMRQLRSDFLKCLSWGMTHYFAAKTRSSEKKSLTSRNIQMTNQNLMLSLDNDCPQSTRSYLDSSRSFHHPNAVTEDDDVAAFSPSRADSVSFTSIFSSDDGRLSDKGATVPPGAVSDDIEMKSRNSSGAQQSRLSARKGTKTEHESDLDSILSDSGFGLPAIDADLKKRGRNKDIVNKTNFLKNGNVALTESYMHVIKIDGTMTSESTVPMVPPEWNEIPVSKEDVDESRKVFDPDWLEHCFKSTYDGTGNAIPHSFAAAITNLTLSCDVIVNIMGVPGKDSSLLGSDHMHQVYVGNIPWSPSLEWLKNRKELYQIVIKAFRYAVKLMYDQVSLGDVENYEELAEYLSEYDEDWFIGCESDQEWPIRLADGRSHLFSLNQDSAKEISVRVLTRRSLSLHLARVNPAAVRGFWANFAAELIYATNDDEERYSIQAHVALLRNLILQTADPPLGYPIFSTVPLSASTFIMM